MLFTHSLALATGTDATSYIEANAGPVLVAVSTSWCVPCRLLKPVLRKLAAEFALPTILLDGDHEVSFAHQYAVKGFPTMLFFRDGQPIHFESGYRDYAELRSKIMDGLGRGDDAVATEQEQSFERGIAAAQQTFETALEPASAALAPHLADVGPRLEAHAEELRREIGTGHLSSQEGQARQDAERRRLYASFQDKIDNHRAAQEAALLAYEAEANRLADAFTVVQMDEPAPELRGPVFCVDGVCSIL